MIKSIFLILGLLAVVAHAAPPAPGALIDVGGYRLHIACEGYGTPTVVFDVGLGGSSLEWRGVVNEVREFTRVCTYDRAGYGWSDVGPLPRTSSVIANELYLLLDAVDIDKPFILAGHSYGGYNMQLFARRYPYLVAGLVLVDSSHPSQVERFMAPPIGLQTMPSTRYGLVKFGEPPEPHHNLSEAAKQLISHQMRHWRTRRTLAHETLGFRDSARQLRAAQALGAIPLMVVSRGKRVWPENNRGNLLEHLWLELQADLADQSPWSAHIVAGDSGHQVHLDQPKLVAYSIAVITDIHRLHNHEGIGIEHQEPTDRTRLEFRAATWLHDSLVIEPHVAIPVVSVSRNLD